MNLSTLAAVTPDAVTSSAQAWITAGVAIFTALVTAAAYVLPRLAELKANIDALKTTQDHQHDRLQDQQAQLSSIALATPAPAQAAAPAQPPVNPKP
jgi:hypothetical protein